MKREKFNEIKSDYIKLSLLKDKRQKEISKCNWKNDYMYSKRVLLSNQIVNINSELTGMRKVLSDKQMNIIRSSLNGYRFIMLRRNLGLALTEKEISLFSFIKS